MSRMSEQAAEQDERENLSGNDMFEHEQWWEKNHRLLKGFEELRPVIQGKPSNTAADGLCKSTEKGK